MADPNIVTFMDSNLLIYYYFSSQPTSGVAIPNQATSGPSSTDLEWYSVWGANGIPGVNGLYGADVATVDPHIPPQWGGRDPFAASGNLVYGTKITSHNKWRNIADWTDNAIYEALGSGDFSFGGWFKAAVTKNAGTDPWVLHFSSAHNSLNRAFVLDINTASPREFVFRKRTTTLETASISTVNSSGDSTPAKDGLWTYWNHVVFTVSRTADGDGNFAISYLNGKPVNRSDDAQWADDITGPTPKFLMMGAADWNLHEYQAGLTFRDFFFFDKILASGEVAYIFNNDISKEPILLSTDNDLVLWYRFNEGSGVPIRSWAANTPVERTNGDPLDTSLQWNNTPSNGIDGVTSINTADPGHSAPYQWGEDRPTPSSTTVDLYHALQSPNMDDSSAVGTIASGSFSVGFWFNFKNVNDIFRLLFSFDRTTGDDNELALGFNTYNANRYRFVYNDGAGSLRYFYDLTNSGSGEMWNHVVITHAEGGDDDGKYARLYINSDLKNTITDPEFDSLLSPYFLTFFNAHADYSDKQFRGAINDFGLFKRVLTPEEIGVWFNAGITLVTSSDDGTIGGYVDGVEGPTESGIIGGFIYASGVASGLVGGYTFGANRASGIIGGFMYASGVASGLIGGYIVGANETSGIIGGFIYASGVASGLVGGYTFGAHRSSGIIGSYIYSVKQISGIIGGFVNCGIAGSGVFDAGFTVKALTATDFDALIEIKLTYNSDFDAVVDIYKAERWPFVSIKYPDGLGLAEGHDVSGVLAPLTPWFVASGVAVDGKTINKTLWNFGDLSPVVTGVPSGNDEYASDHTYSTSGIYIATFRAIDSDGLSAADSIKIHLASGVSMPDVTLSATPIEGEAPLSVDFDYSITNIPPGVTITSKILFLGNGKSTINPNVTYVYSEPGSYIPILVVFDSRGIITSDSLKIGVNN